MPPDFQMLRLSPADLSRYLPAFLYKDPQFTAVQHALELEHERQRQDGIDMEKQFFVATATWGLADWEEFVGLPVQPEQDAAARRNNILARLIGAQSVTIDFIRNLINLYVTDGTGDAEDHPEEYSISITIPEGKYTRLEELKETLDVYIPAHIGLSYDFITRLSRTFTFYGQGMDRVDILIPPAPRQTSFVKQTAFAGRMMFLRVDMI